MYMEGKQTGLKTIPEVKDRFYITYGAFYLMGILTFIPFLFFINAFWYWNYKFREFPQLDSVQGRLDSAGPHPEAPVERNLGLNQLPFNGSSFQNNFTTSFNVVGQGSILISIMLVPLLAKRFPPPEKRIVASLTVICALFAVSTCLTQVDTTEEVELFFAASIITLTVINFFSATAIISMYQLVTKFPVSYYASLSTGQSICGVIASLFQIILLSTRIPPDSNGAYYFGFGTLSVLFTLLFYLTVKKKSKYFIYRVNSIEGQVDSLTRLKFDRNKIVSTIRKIKWYYACLMFVQGTSILVHPGFTALVVSENWGKTNSTAWEEIYFRPVVTFLIFSVCNMIGRETARIVKTPKNSFIIMVPALLRILFVPMIIFCNALPRNHLPVYFGDNWYICLISTFAFTEGILVNICILAIPTLLDNDEIEDAMMLIPVITIFSAASCSGLNVLITNLNIFPMFLSCLAKTYFYERHF